ncbi:hypothetical protein [Actinophytocola sediminis]
MATEPIAGVEPEVLTQLDDQHGPQWIDWARQRWGADWAQPCQQELAEHLGPGWESETPETKYETLTTLLIGPTAHTETAAEESVPPIADTPWLATLTEVDSFAAWLVRIGIDEQLVASLDGAAGEAQREEVPSLEETPWLATLTEADSFSSWLMRIGVPAEMVASFEKSASDQPAEELT